MSQPKELIDWSTAPVGIKTTAGFVIHEGSTAVCIKGDQVYIEDIDMSYPAENRFDPIALAPAGQQPWILYEEGITVIPKWAEATYRGYMRGRQGLHGLSYKEGLDYLHSYKLGNIEGKLFKDGWTDDASEVAK